MRVLYFLFIILSFVSCKTKQENSGRLAKSFKENKNGWVYVHLEGSPSNIGYQHGYLLSTEIDTAIQSVSYYLNHDTKKIGIFIEPQQRIFYGQN